MERSTERLGFDSDVFCEKLIALRTKDPVSYSRLGKITLALLRKYETTKKPDSLKSTSEATRERRNTDRIQTYLEATWEGNSGVHDATISDLSTDGCFILTSGQTWKNEYVKISLHIPETGWISLCGIVTNYFEEIGFGARFVQLTWEGMAQLPAQILTGLRMQPTSDVR